MIRGSDGKDYHLPTGTYVRRQLFFPLNDNENSRRMLLSLSLLLFSPFHA
jgi:hypothetical protein